MSITIDLAGHILGEMEKHETRQAIKNLCTRKPTKEGIACIMTESKYDSLQSLKQEFDCAVRMVRTNAKQADYKMPDDTPKSTALNARFDRW